MRAGKQHAGTERMMAVILDSIRYSRILIEHLLCAKSSVRHHGREKELRKTISVRDNMHVAPSERTLSFQDAVTHFPQQV